jgi:hypothetical protein
MSPERFARLVGGPTSDAGAERNWLADRLFSVSQPIHEAVLDRESA